MSTARATSTPEPRIVRADEIASDPSALGGKATNLAALTLAGLPVPEWFAVTTAVGDDLFAGVRALVTDAAALDPHDAVAIQSASERIVSALRAASLSAGDAERLRAAFDATFARDALVAVRSSAVGEDSERDSFAGQLDTYLFVTRDTLIERVVACFASAFSGRAIAYRLRRGHPVDRVRSAVVVQRMIDASVAGVLFTANPTTGARDEIVISAGLGLGEGVVDGTVDCDTFYCDRAGGIRMRTIVDKGLRVVFDVAAGTGTKLDEVHGPDRRAPALTEVAVRALCELALRAEASRGPAQDIEWALDSARRPYVLQARPITTLALGHEEIFDSANIVESYPGVSSPLTFSVARAGYEATFRDFQRSLGVPEEILAKNQIIYANLVSYLDGRIYYQLLSWYGIIRTVPGFEWAIAGWEKALGLRRRYDPPPRRSFGERVRTAPIVLRIYATFLKRFFDVDDRARAYLRELAAVREEVDAALAADADAHRLVSLAEVAQARLMAPYSISLVNDSFAQQFHEVVGRLIARYEIGDASLRNELLCGESGVESVEPLRSVLALTETIRSDPRLLALFEGDAAPSDVWASLQRDAAFERFRAEADAHLDRYGDRTLHELKLETPSIRESPAFLVTMIRNFLRGGLQLDAMEEREREIRRRAEEAVARALAGHPVRSWVFGFALARLRSAVKWRENLRLARTRAFGIVKRLYGAVAARFVEAGVIDAPEDVFFLTAEEIVGVVRGTSATRDVRALVALRRRERDTYASRELPSRIVTHGIVGAATFGAKEHASESATGVLKGIGCAPGKVRGVAKIVLDPSADLRVDGHVLVAPMTDPGWVFLMAASKALVSERGSLLSHTAIIGRELGIPTVVGVKDATRRIADGAEVVVDGTSGEVSLLPE